MIVTLEQLCPQDVKKKRKEKTALSYCKSLGQMKEVTFFFNVFFNGEGVVEKLNLNKRDCCCSIIEYFFYYL